MKKAIQHGNLRIVSHWNEIRDKLALDKLQPGEKETEVEQAPSIPPALTITESAIAAIREVMESQQVPEGYQLRVGVRSQGMACAGMSFMLGFDQKKEEDMELEVAGMAVLVDRRHSMYVLGMEIDWHEDERQRGFVFNNPSKRKT